MAMDEQALREKLAKIEALFEGASTDGERAAAESARERIRKRLEAASKDSPPIEVKFAMADVWSRKLLVALLRRYGIQPYRLRGMRHTTVMAKISKKLLDETLWPEFVELDKVLRQYLEEVTARVVAQVVHPDASEAAEVATPRQLGSGGKGES